MPNISLRAYQQKIESWIDENKIDKAIYQSSLILNQFPKNLHTFQILSKALLQKQDFVNAEKAFDIILQIEPDDFVSHIGKSMIAENNHLLDSAIEHMKSAFEIQPSNEGLQNEIKRLLLAKDNVEPKRINLSRGALIKMYLKGKLYQQAIAEARIGISETPHRLDYKVAMAKSFFESGDLISAVETCIEIVSQLPYCLPANEILDKVLSKSNMLDKNGFYHNRLIELDPYYSFMLSSTKSVYDVPDIAVMIEDASENEAGDYDLEPIFNASWKDQNQSDGKEYLPSERIDWDSIISSGLDSQVIPDNLINSDIVQNGVELNNHLSSDNMSNSRKKIFLNRLRVSKSSQEESTDIPDWFFDDNGEISHMESGSDIIDEENIPFEDLGSELISKPPEFSSDENGVFDADVLPAINGDEEMEQSKQTWVNDEDTSIQMPTPNQESKLDDTQQISVVKENPNDLLIDSAKALEGGNTKFALMTLHKLISKKMNLLDVSNQLERAIELYPDRSDFRLLLGETYSLLDEKEKALAILHNAQKYISL
jgi:tetratricopeptide (TPR) repeat protein